MLFSLVEMLASKDPPDSQVLRPGIRLLIGWMHTTSIITYTKRIMLTLQVADAQATMCLNPEYNHGVCTDTSVKWVNKAAKLSNFCPINCLMTRKAALDLTLDIASLDLWEQVSESSGNLVTVKRVTLGVE